MRRGEKEIKERDLIIEIINNNNLCRLALISRGKPYVVPLNYGYNNDFLYLHCASEGKKIDCIKENNNVCFEISDSVEIIHAEKACAFSAGYRSVIGEGQVFFAEDLEEKKIGLSAIMNQVTSNDKWDFPDKAVEKLTVLKIRVDNITGKISGK